MKKCLLFFLFASCASAGAQQETKLKPGPTGETISITKVRNYAFCEIIVGFGRIAPSTELHVYDSTGTTGPDSGCPAETFATLTPGKLAMYLDA